MQSNLKVRGNFIDLFAKKTLSLCSLVQTDLSWSKYWSTCDRNQNDCIKHTVQRSYIESTFPPKLPNPRYRYIAYFPFRPIRKTPIGYNASMHTPTDALVTKIMTSNLRKAHETRDSLTVPVRRLSCSISIHFVAIHS